MEAKRIAEAEFSQQRGKFMEIFKQKEGYYEVIPCVLLCLLNHVTALGRISDCKTEFIIQLKF